MLRSLGVAFAGLVAVFLPLLMGWRDLPWRIPEMLMLIGAIAATVITFRRRGEPGRWRMPATALLWGGMGLYAIWTLSMSAYADAPLAPTAGSPAPPIHGVRVRDGARFELAALREFETLLVFYRGPW